MTAYLGDLRGQYLGTYMGLLGPTFRGSPELSKSQSFRPLTAVKSVCPHTRVGCPAKTLVLSYYCLYSLFNKIRDKGKTVSAGYLGVGGRGRGWSGWSGGGGGRERNDPSLVYTYE
jgi:hypothetical protein